MATPDGSTAASSNTASTTDSFRVAPSRILLVASLGAFLAFLDSTVVEVAFPSIAASFPGSSIGGMSWVLNSYNIAFAACLIVFGRLTDLIGRRRAFVGGTLLFTIASAACGAAPSLDLLVVARLAQGLGAALLVPASLALVVDAFGGSHRTRAISLWGATAAVAAGMGPPVGGLLIEGGGWRWAFLINVPFGLATVVVAHRYLDESRAPGHRSLPDLLGAGLLAGAMGLLNLGIIKGQDWGWTSGGVLGCFLATAILAGLFVASSRRHPEPLLDVDLLRVRAFSISTVALVISGLGFFANGITNILWLQYVWDYSVLEAGLALVPGALVAAVVATIVGPLAERFDARPFIVLGILTWALAFVWYLQRVGPDPAFWQEWLPGQVLSGIGVGAALPLLGSVGLAAVPGGRYATASAIASSARQFGGVLGIAVLVALIGTLTPATVVDSLHRGWILSIVAFIAAAIVAAFLGRLPDSPVVEGARLSELDTPRIFAPDPPSSWEPTTRSLVGHGALAQLPDESRRRLEESMVPVRLPAGRYLIRAGESPDSAYTVRTGRLEVIVDDEVVRELGPGDIIGELALLTGEPRSADIRARRDTSLLEIPGTAFDELTMTDPRASRTLLRQMAERLRTARNPAGSRAPNRATVVSVVPLTPGAPVGAVGHELARAIGQHHSVVVLDEVNQQGLERAEEDHGRVVLVCEESSPPGWREFCLRQADTVVVVAHADRRDTAQSTSPAPSRQAELVLVGADPGPAERAAWVDQTDAWDLTLVGAELRGELRSLAARLSGRAIGFVLGGGGASGLAHIGVLREFEAAGIPVDRVAGTSAGAIMGAGHALGLDSEGLEAATYSASVRSRIFSDWQVPTHALLRGKRFEAAMARFIGEDTVIEGLSSQLWLVSTDLLTGTRHVHRRGNLLEAIVASSRIPGLFAPIPTDSGQLLVDGGVLDNLPVDLLVQRDEGPVVAVNIGTETVPATHTHGRPSLPSLVDTLALTMSINSSHSIRVARSNGAWVVCTPRMGAGLLEFHQMDVLIEAGRSAGRALLEFCDGDLGALGQTVAATADAGTPHS